MKLLLRSSFEVIHENYFEQHFVSGQEYTVDAYANRAGRLLAAMSRKRLQVPAMAKWRSQRATVTPILLRLTRASTCNFGLGGPDNTSVHRWHQWPGSSGTQSPIGGGVTSTHSLRSRFFFPRWLLREHLGRPIEPCQKWPDGSLMTRCRRDVFYDNFG